MLMSWYRKRSTTACSAGWGRSRSRLFLEWLEDRTLLDSSAATSALLASYGQLPLSFESNQGQTDPSVNFLSHGSGYGLFLTPTEAVLSLQKAAADPTSAPAPDVLRMQLVGANAAPHIVGQDQLPGTSNYLVGNDPSQWHTNIANYGKVEYQDLYPGVNLVYYGNQQQLEYDWVVTPGADPGVIRLAFTGQQGLELDGQGNLVLHTAGSDVVEQAPVVYQQSAAGREAVTGRYVLEGNGQVGFAVGAYDASRPLIIDPILSYSTYLGGSFNENGLGIAVDSAGNAYVTGFTTSNNFLPGNTNFPTANALQPDNGGGADAFVSKLNASGTMLLYSTYLGGSGNDGGSGIAVDSAGNAYVTGTTNSTNFPTANALQPAFGGGGDDAFVSKLNASGTMLSYSTYLGGSGGGGIFDEGTGIAVDSAGNAYIAGRADSTNFPTTAGAFQTAQGGAADAFVAKIAVNLFTVFGRTFGATEGLPFTGVVAFFVDNRGPAPASSYTALVDWGDGSSSSASVMSFDGGFNVIGSHVYAHEGSYAVTVTVLTADSQTVTIGSTATVADARLIPVGKMNIPFTEASPFGRVVASFQNADTGSFAGEHTASITWGDGSPSSPGTISANGTGFDVTGLHTYATKSSTPYPITVTITDAGGAMTVANSTALVDSPPLSGQGKSISVFGNKNFSGAVATFTDPDPRKNPARYQATITWPNGSPSTDMGTITGSNPFTVSDNHTFTSFPGTLTITIVVTDLDIPGRSVTIYSRVADPTAPTMEQVFVGQLYQDLLGRPAEDGGLTYWTGLLQGGSNREQIVQGIVNSDEYHGRQVQQLYHTYLHRDVDPVGLSTFSGLLAQGGTVEQVQALIVGSPEYWQNEGGGTNAGFLTALYHDVLGRDIDAVGQQVFGQALNQGMTPAQVAALVFQSDEYRQDWVQAAYGQLLHRPTDPTGLAAFTGALQQGVADAAVLAAIAGSSEYFANLELPASL